MHKSLIMVKPAGIKQEHSYDARKEAVPICTFRHLFFFLFSLDKLQSGITSEWCEWSVCILEKCPVCLKSDTYPIAIANVER